MHERNFLKCIHETSIISASKNKTKALTWGDDFKKPGWLLQFQKTARRPYTVLGWPAASSRSHPFEVSATYTIEGWPAAGQMLTGDWGQNFIKTFIGLVGISKKNFIKISTGFLDLHKFSTYQQTSVEPFLYIENSTKIKINCCIKFKS